MKTKTQQWYASWFNTPYYYLLYKDRGYDEAQSFMEKLTDFLDLDKNSHILDLACGKGRHSIYLNRIGYEVTGLDLSEESILYAKQFENDRLHFDIHDMSRPYSYQFDAVLNLFTSFGYFDDESDNLNTIKAIKSDLKASGMAVIDFMNVRHVISNLVPADTKTIDGITFNMSRYLDNDHIIKDISFEDKGTSFNYQERVKAFSLSDFKMMFKEAEVELLHIFGDYNLNPFNENTSERLIMIFR